MCRHVDGCRPRTAGELASSWRGLSVVSPAKTTRLHWPPRGAGFSVFTTHAFFTARQALAAAMPPCVPGSHTVPPAWIKVSVHPSASSASVVSACAHIVFKSNKKEKSNARNPNDRSLSPLPLPLISSCPHILLYCPLWKPTQVTHLVFSLPPCC